MFNGPEGKRKKNFFLILSIIVIIGHLFAVMLPMLLEDPFSLEKTLSLTANYCIIWLVILLFYMIYKMNDIFLEKKKNE